MSIPKYPVASMDDCLPRLSTEFSDQISSSSSSSSLPTYIAIVINTRWNFLLLDDLHHECHRYGTDNKPQLIPELCYQLLFANQNLVCDWKNQYKDRSDFELLLGFLHSRGITLFRSLVNIQVPFAIHSTLSCRGFDDDRYGFKEYMKKCDKRIFKHWLATHQSNLLSSSPSRKRKHEESPGDFETTSSETKLLKTEASSDELLVIPNEEENLD